MNERLFLRATPAGLLLLAVAACGPSDEARPNIVLVTLDTTRSDHLSCYGYRKRTSPHLDALASDGVRYERAYAVSSWTLPSHASLFTGKFPSSHGAHYDPDGNINLVMEGGIRAKSSWSNYRANTIAADEVTLAELLSERGYATHGVVAGPWMKKVFGLARGFDGYDDSNFVFEDGSEVRGRIGEDVTDAAIRFVDEHADEPFFLFLNYYDAHPPYPDRPKYIADYWNGPPPAQDSLEWLLARYDAEIRYQDEHFGRFLAHLKGRGLYEDAWICVIADHGQLMGDLGMVGHGHSLSEAEINVPLIVKEPGADRRRGVDSTPVQQVDVFGAALEVAGMPLPDGTQGATLDAPDHAILAEVYPLPMMDLAQNPWRQQGDWRAYYEGDWKFVWGSNGRHLLFDLSADPGEARNLVDEDPDRAAAMLARLEATFGALPAPGAAPEIDVSAEDLRALRAVGYLDGDETDVEGALPSED